MTNELQERNQQFFQDRLREISRSLNVMATVQVLSLLHTPTQLDKMSRRHQELRAAHMGAIAGLAAENKKLEQKYGDDKSSKDSLVEAFGESLANEICVDRNQAFETVSIHYRELKIFEADPPNIGTLSQFLVERDS